MAMTFSGVEDAVGLLSMQSLYSHQHVTYFSFIAIKASILKWVTLNSTRCYSYFLTNPFFPIAVKQISLLLVILLKMDSIEHITLEAIQKL